LAILSYTIKATDLARESYTKTTNLGQTVARVWLLASVLTMILSDVVSTDDEHWDCLSSLIEIMRISFSSEIGTETVIYLRAAIKRHLKLFKSLYNAPIIPKQHFMVHLPSQILQFGPLIHAWCMRFEGKHAHFKDLASRVRNFKNLPYSLAHRNQKLMCADYMEIDNSKDTSPLFGNEHDFGKRKELNGEERNKVQQLLYSSFGDLYQVSPTNQVFLCNSVTLNGITYCPGKKNYLHIACEESGLPTFARLVQIWGINNLGTFFLVNAVDTIAFHNDLRPTDLVLKIPPKLRYDSIYNPSYN